MATANYKLNKKKSFYRFKQTLKIEEHSTLTSKRKKSEVFLSSIWLFLN